MEQDSNGDGYYNLNKVKGYVDGMIPLLLVVVMMAVVTVSVAVSGGRIHS